MFNKEQVIQEAVEAVIERTDLEPGEVNRNISKVMQTMDEANEQFAQIQSKLTEIKSTANKLDTSSANMAEAGVEMAKGAQSIAEEINELQDTQTDLVDSMEELNLLTVCKNCRIRLTELTRRFPKTTDGSNFICFEQGRSWKVSDRKNCCVPA